MRVPMVDLSAQHRALRTEIDAAVARVLASNTFILGPEVDAFEREAEAFLGIEHAVGVSSGTDALTASLMALGVGVGDEVLTTPFSFFATVGSIVRVGATPRFADVDAETLNIDPARAAEAMTSRTRAIVVVHLFGRPAPMEGLAALSERHGVALVEDAAQAFGVHYQARAAGTWGTIGCFSFFPGKPLGALGDGGLVVTRDRRLSERIRRVARHGAEFRHHHTEMGGNFRLDALQAAVLRVKLLHVETWLAQRREHAVRYSENLRGTSGLRVPDATAESVPIAPYVLRVLDGRRDALAEYLGRHGVETAVHYPRALYAQPALAGLGVPEGTCPNAEAAAAEVLALPLFPEMTRAEHDYVTRIVRQFFDDCR